MANFEDRLIAAAGEENVKQAKKLLKQKNLVGAWRNNSGELCGVFRENGVHAADVRVSTGEHAVCVCSQCGDGGVCAHGAALMMYSGRFFIGDTKDETLPVYAKGLLMQNFEQLSVRGMKNCAKLKLNVLEDQLHAPNQYKILVLSVKLIGASREYTGNLGNLRQLYFEKSLSVVLKYDDFSLHDQQIIRFLALNGEAENSNIAIGAELTAELFHALPGFPRFFRNGNLISVRPERAEAVLVRVKNKLVPGIAIDHAVLPMSGARLIAGRSGCWVGKDDEYFFIGGSCEAGFLRSFFRMTPQDAGKMTDFPLPVVSADAIDPEPRKAALMLDGGFNGDGSFCLKINYLYDFNGRKIILSPRSGKICADARGCFRRDVENERFFENSLSLMGFETDDASAAAVTDSIERAGVFLDRAMQDIVSTFSGEVVFSAGLARLANGGGGLSGLPVKCTLAEKREDSYFIRYCFGESGNAVPWEKLYDAAVKYDDYIMHSGRVFSLSEAIGKFMRASVSLIRELDTVGGYFEVPFANWPYFCKLAAPISGAMPQELIGEFAADKHADIPRDTFSFSGELRNYQKQGVAFMQFLADRGFNPLLADEMGLGKTVQLLALISSRMSRSGLPSLIVCPASLVENWAREAGRFVPEFRVAFPSGSIRGEVLKKRDFDLLILSYASAKLCQDELKKINFEFLVLDEAQHIKNPGSTNAKNCKSIRAVHRVVLSGTPLENSPEDLWSVMDFLQPGLLGTLPAFRRRYAGIANNRELQEEFIGRISPFIKRRTKSEVASDLPKKSERVLFCEMPAEQRAVYDDILQRNRDVLRTGGSAELFALLLRLRQCCCHPALLPDGGSTRVPSGKMELLFELLNETIDSGHKVLLFSQFTSMLKLISEQLDSCGIPFEYLDGSTRDRQQRVDRFNNDPDAQLFLLSLKAGGTGLNLTSADTVIIYDPWWNPAVESQAADRTHRIGQTRPVSTIKLVMKDSVEEKVLQLQQKKRKLFNSLVEDPAAAGGISIAELRDIMGQLCR